MTFLELAQTILKEAKTPLAPTEIWQTAVDKGYDKQLNSDGKTPWATLYAEIYVSVRDNPKSPFQVTDSRPKKFFLKSQASQLEVSKEADQPAIPLTEKVNKLLEKFKDNIILLDAVYQWAAAPTGVIGLRHPPDHGLRKSNLQIRYGLDEKDAQNIYDRFRDEVVSAGIDDFDSGYLDVGRTVIKYFSDENPVLKDAALQRLKTASEQDKYIAWLYCKGKDDYRIWSVREGPTKEYLAVLKATFGTKANLDKVTQTLTKLGFINRLEWGGGKHSQNNYKRSSGYCFPDYLRQVAETVDDIVPLPELPDYKRFVDALLEKKLVDALIAIERFLNNDSEYKKDLPTQPYITAEHDGVYAVNWRIRDDFKKYFFDIKGKETQDIAEKIERILKNLGEKHYPSISLIEVGEAGFEGVPAWRLSIHDPFLSEKEIHIVIAPWFTVEQLKSLVVEANSKFVVLLPSMAGIPKLKTMYRDAFYKDINESGLNLAILDFTKEKVFEEIFGSPSKLYEEIVEGLKNSGCLIEKGRVTATNELKSEPIIKTAEKEAARVEKRQKVEEETKQLSPFIASQAQYPGLSVFLGLLKNNNEKIFWQPGSLNNGHFILIGGAGAGKTETLRCIASDLDKNNFPVLMIDFHGDMACEGGNIKTYEIGERSQYYFNPLELNPLFKDITPLRAGSDFVDAMSINFTELGVQQRNRLKDIIKEAYERNGITTEMETWTRELNFAEIEEVVKNTDDKVTQTTAAYLNDIFDYKLFSGAEKISIKGILDKGISHINLKPLPESLRALYADLFLRKIYYSLQALGEIPRGDISDEKKFRLFVIVDEAKLLVSERQGTKAVLNKYATELRKYGVGLILASQLIDHFTDEILSNIATKLCMKAENNEQAKKHSKVFGASEKDLIDFEQGGGILIVGGDRKNIKIVPTRER